MITLSLPYLGLSAGTWKISVGIFGNSGIAPIDWRWFLKEIDVSDQLMMHGRFMLTHEWGIQPA